MSKATHRTSSVGVAMCLWPTRPTTMKSIMYPANATPVKSIADLEVRLGAAAAAASPLRASISRALRIKHRLNKRRNSHSAYLQGKCVTRGSFQKQPLWIRAIITTQRRICENIL